MTAIGGLLPLALEGSGLYSPLAIAIIGGLITSTFLSLLVIPVVFTYVDDILAWVHTLPERLAKNRDRVLKRGEHL